MAFVEKNADNANTESNVQGLNVEEPPSSSVQTDKELLFPDLPTELSNLITNSSEDTRSIPSSPVVPQNNLFEATPVFRQNAFIIPPKDTVLDNILKAIEEQKENVNKIDTKLDTLIELVRNVAASNNNEDNINIKKDPKFQVPKLPINRNKKFLKLNEFLLNKEYLNQMVITVNYGFNLLME